MKKRLRKKLHKAEFQELGFNLEFDLSEADNEGFYEKFLDSFITEAIEGNDLECGGGGRERQEFFVVQYRGSVSEEQRNAVKEWLEKQSHVSNIVLGELRDAWYGWE
ncbi:MAG: YggL family protein [Candidatus Azobacteroides sp.]|nr:YggL family protein [Candidatus Azobacteroides sp.]